MLYSEDKFEIIYEKYKNLIMKIAYEMTGDYYLSQDICQETFLKLYNFREKIDETRVRSWLVVVAANLLRDWFRKNGKSKEILNGSETMEEYQERVNCVDAYLDQLEREELNNRMLEGLRTKNENWYETLILVEYMDVPRKAIAKRLGIALSTVDSYLKKGMKWMKENYQDEYDEL